MDVDSFLAADSTESLLNLIALTEENSLRGQLTTVDKKGMFNTT